MRKFMVATLLAAVSSASHAAPVQAKPLQASYQDWYIGCDNVKHCEAVGYHEDTEGSAPVALMLARDGGPDAPVQAFLFLSDEDVESIRSVSVSVAGLRMDGLPIDKAWTPAQSGAIAPKLLNADAAEFRTGNKTWRLSLAGAKAALLKMDEVQGRLDTPGALVRKGTRPESAVPQPPAPPLLRKAAGLHPEPAMEAPPGLEQALPRNDCVEQGYLAAYRLSASRMLVLRECYRGAYQSSHLAWTATRTPPYRFQQVMLPQPDGAMIDDLVSPEYADGILKSWVKGRGMSDCGTSIEWVWTDQGFKLLSYQGGGFCRGIVGGVPPRLWTATLR